MARLNRLGAFQFRNWIGNPPASRIRERTEVLSSPGVDYQAVRLLGVQSDAHVLESIVDQPSVINARMTYAAYCGAIGGAAMKLVWNDHDYDQENMRAVALDCELVSIERKAAICGALVPGWRVDLRVRWRVLLVPFNLPEE